MKVWPHPLMGRFPFVVTVCVLVTSSGTARAQFSPCQIDLRAGFRQAPEKLPVADGSPVGPMIGGPRLGTQPETVHLLPITAGLAVEL